MIRLNKSLQKCPPQNKKIQNVSLRAKLSRRKKKAQEAQKKAFTEAIIENKQLKQAAIPTAAPPTAEPPAAEPESAKITTTQWLSVIGIFVSLLGIYYKREEIKGLLARPQVYTPPPAPPNSPVLPRKGINLMD